jgi:hypothetical protein
MEELFNRLISDPLARTAERILQFLPNLVSAVLLVLAGLAVGLLTKIVLKRIFVVIRLDGLSERVGLKALLAKGGIQEPLSLLLARITGGLVVFVFFLAALNNLEFGIIQNLIERLFIYLPSIFMALVVLVLGYLLGNFLGRAALIAAVNAGVRVSGHVGRGVKLFIYLLSVTMALELLGIGRDTVLLTYSITFAGIVLALAIAFGLGGKDAAREYLEKRLKAQERDDDFHHL